jgi:glycosyltransferase involved in cell wall biosynthesis
MIVKNEADILARCLDTVADLMDEIIIVDTGSSDETKAIAARYTDKLYDFAWDDDFAAARNFAFSKAGGDYIYSADADEVMDEANRQRFRELKETLDGEVELVQMYYANQLKYGTVYNYDREYRPKLFKRQRSFTWLDPVHETIRTEPVIFDSEIEIIHQPKESHATRDLRIFEGIVKEGRPLSKRLHNMYARELFIVGEKEDFYKSEAYFEASAADTEQGLEQIKEAACVVAKSARLRGDTEKFFKFALKDIGSEGCSEMCCELGEFYRQRKDYHEAIVWFYNAAFETTAILDLKCNKDTPLTGLVNCYKALGMAKEAAEYEKMMEVE